MLQTTECLLATAASVLRGLLIFLLKRGLVQRRDELLLLLKREVLHGDLGDLSALPADSQALQGSFSAVSKPTFASKYSSTHVKALAEIYTIHSFAPFFDLNF